MDPLDLILIMEQEDIADTDVTDGKIYTATVSGLSPLQWKSRIVVENSEACKVSTSFDAKPFVSDNLLDLSIYASDISFSRSNPAIGEPIKIYARIKNPSDFAAENFVVSLYAEDANLSTRQYPILRQRVVSPWNGNKVSQHPILFQSKWLLMKQMCSRKLMS